MSHTPSPWKVSAWCRNGAWTYAINDGDQTAEEAEANLLLMESVPDLLAACKAVLAGFCDIGQIEKAVAKAEGGTP